MEGKNDDKRNEKNISNLYGRHSSPNSLFLHKNNEKSLNERRNHQVKQKMEFDQCVAATDAAQLLV